MLVNDTIIGVTTGPSKSLTPGSFITVSMILPSRPSLSAITLANAGFSSAGNLPASSSSVLSSGPNFSSSGIAAFAESASLTPPSVLARPVNRLPAVLPASRNLGSIENVSSTVSVTVLPFVSMTSLRSTVTGPFLTRSSTTTARSSGLFF